jgi:hypothetical protein
LETTELLQIAKNNLKRFQKIEGIAPEVKRNLIGECKNDIKTLKQY